MTLALTTRQELIEAGVIRPCSGLSPLPAEVDGEPFLPLDEAGRASAAASIGGRLNDQREIDISNLSPGAARAARRNAR
jgi:hypothetical protein